MTATTQDPRSARRALAGLTLWVPAGALALAAGLLRGSVPDRMASHWAAGGRVDGVSGTWASFGVTLAIVAGAAVLGSVVLAVSDDGRLARTVSTLAGAVAGLVATTWIVSAGATALAGSAASAVLGWWLAVVIAALLWGAVPFALLPIRVVPTPTSDRVSPVATVPGERIAWAGDTGSLVIEWAGALVLLTGLVMLGARLVAGAEVPVVLIVVLLALGVVAAAMGRARLTIDQRGVRLVTRLMGVPIMRIPLEALVTVDVVEIEPLAWGGWGYRTSPGRRAYVARKGPGIVLTDVRGGVAAITTPDAAAAAAVAAALLRVPGPAH